MKKLLSYIPYQYIQLIALALIIVGFYWGKGAISCGIISLCTAAVINPKIGNYLRALRNERLAWWSFAMFAVLLVSGIWSANMQYYKHELLLHLPYLVFPLIFVSIKEIELKYFHYLLILFALLSFVGTIYSAYDIFTNANATIENYKVGKSALTPFKGDHIRFGLAVLISMLILYFENKRLQQKVFKYISFVLIIWMGIYLHLLASKTSLLCLYFAIFLQLLFTLRQTKWWVSLAVLVAMLLAPIAAYQFSPTFKTKAHYLLYSLYQINNNTQQTKVSDEGRIISYQLAWQVFKQNMLFGVGAGDLKDEMDKAYATQFANVEEEKKLIPHNQFLVALLIGGIVGLVIFTLFICAPLGTIPFRKVLLFKTFWYIYWIPLLVEPLHEAQLSLTLHLFFLFLLNTYAQKQIAEA